MKILHVVRGLSNSSGTTHIVVPLAEEQARQGMDVTVFFVEKDNQQPVVPDSSLVSNRCFPLSLPFSNPGLSLSFARTIECEIEQFDFAHIHAVWNIPTLLTMRAAARAGVPYMVAPQGSFEPWALAQSRWKKRVYGRLTEGPLLNRAHYLQALTPKEAEQFRRYGLSAQSIVIPNGIETSRFEGSAPRLVETLGLPQNARSLLFLSRLHPKKGVDILLRAFGEVHALHPDVTLIVAGDDAGSGYRRHLEDLAHGLGLGRKCRFVGEIRGLEKYQMLLGADAFALTSHSEGLPVAVVEAMAAGLPVLITHGCNIPEVAEREAGLVVNAEVDEVKDALATLLNDTAAAALMGTNAKRLVARKFTWPIIARQTIDAYEQALGQPAAA